MQIELLRDMPAALVRSDAENTRNIVPMNENLASILKSIANELDGARQVRDEILSHSDAIKQFGHLNI